MKIRTERVKAILEIIENCQDDPVKCANLIDEMYFPDDYDWPPARQHLNSVLGT
jgi:hypothetical protein